MHLSSNLPPACGSSTDFPDTDGSYVSGSSNAQIGAELYISPKTAGVHVSSILRKLGVSGRVHAAALARCP